MDYCGAVNFALQHFTFFYAPQRGGLVGFKEGGFELTTAEGGSC